MVTPSGETGVASVTVGFPEAPLASPNNTESSVSKYLVEARLESSQLKLEVSHAPLPVFQEMGIPTELLVAVKKRVLVETLKLPARRWVRLVNAAGPSAGPLPVQVTKG